MNSEPIASRLRLCVAAVFTVLLVTITTSFTHAQPRAARGATHSGAVRAEEGSPTVSIEPVMVVEGNAGSVLATLTVSLSKPVVDSVFVEYVVFDSTATVENQDYVANAGTLVIPPDSLTALITVEVLGDLKYEPDETVGVYLVGAVNATVAGGLASVTISNDDTTPTISVGDVTLMERNGGLRNAVFTVSLSNPSATPVTVDYQTADGTATLANGDYLETHGTLTIPAKALSDTIAVAVVGDTTFETSETFFLNLSNPVGATLGDGQGTATIQNDDTRPTIVINDVSVTEGNAGTAMAVFTITLSNPSYQNISVNWRTVDNTATVASGDYLTAMGTASFPTMSLTSTVTALVNGDIRFELDERFRVSLTVPVNATIARAQGTCTIVNDDPVPVVSIDDVAQLEESDGVPHEWLFFVNLSNPSERPLTINYQTADGTATVANGDYVSKAALLSVPLLAIRDTIRIQVVADTKDETDETFFVNLLTASGASIPDSQFAGTILDDDGVPSIAVVEGGKNEGDEGLTDMKVTVALSNPTALETIEVDYHTEDGTATLANNDYIPTSGHLVFPPKTDTTSFIVQIHGDIKREEWETIRVVLTNPVNATLAEPGEGFATIQDDDAEPLFFIDDAVVTEGTGGQTALVFSVNLSVPSQTPVQVNYATEDVTAKAGQPDLDFVPVEGTLVFEPKTLKATVTVMVNADTHDEPDETLIMRLSQPLHGTIRDQEGIGTILDDDPAPPVVALSSPNGGEFFVPGETAKLAWTASSGVGVTGIDLLISYDAGNSFHPIALGEENDGTYDWTVTAPVSDPPALVYAMVRVVAHAVEGDDAEDTSDRAFTIVDPYFIGADDMPVTAFALSAVAPNPSRGPISVGYALPKAAAVRVSVLDVQGREVAVLADGTLGAGRHRASWDGSAPGIAAGMYFVRYVTPERCFVRRIVIAK